ncbi:hypothetical protein [Cryptosporangium arvum]|nr:hypothetical protein [Cryptosporangium arvum]
MSLSLVCLPDDTPAERIAAAAEASLAALSLTTHGPADHFLAGRRRHWFSRIEHESIAGGRLHHLDLAAMRNAAYQLNWYRWTVWQQVVANTRPAQPYWTFLAHHRTTPTRYPLDRAQQDYLAQPRVLVMNTYNALPHRAMDLPTSHLEALQLGSHAYAHFGWLSAVPGDRLLCLDGTLLTAGTGQLAPRMDYLAEANGQIDTLAPDDIVVALRTP